MGTTPAQAQSTWWYPTMIGLMVIFMFLPCFVNSSSIDCEDNGCKRESVSVFGLGNGAEDYHLMMISDERRNSVYEESIKRTVGGKRVLEIGAGSGLLVLMASRHGAEHVTAVEMNSFMFRKSLLVLARNGCVKQEEQWDWMCNSTRVRLLNLKSTELTLGNGHDQLPMTVNVLLSEIISCDLLSESVVSSTFHAVKFLNPNDRVIIPGLAKVYLQPMFGHYGMRSMDDFVSGFDLGPMRDMRRTGYTCTGLSAHGSVPFGADSLANEPTMVFEVNFSDIVNAVRPGYWQRTIDLNIQKPGIFNAVALTWEVFLLPSSEELFITNHVGSPNGDWCQPVYYISRDHFVDAGEQVRVTLRSQDPWIQWTIHDEI